MRAIVFSDCTLPRDYVPLGSVFLEPSARFREKRAAKFFNMAFTKEKL